MHRNHHHLKQNSDENHHLEKQQTNKQTQHKTNDTMKYKMI